MKLTGTATGTGTLSVKAILSEMASLSETGTAILSETETATAREIRMVTAMGSVMGEARSPAAQQPWLFGLRPSTPRVYPSPR